MIRWIVDASLRFRRLVIALAVGAIAVGVYQAQQTPVDVLPEFSPPTVEVQTEALGLSAAEVEQLITVPLEQDLLVGVAFLQDIESVSLPGLSSVVLTFEPGTDLLAARQVVQERLTQAVGVAGLPAVAKPPQMIQPLSSSSRVSMVKLTADDLTQIQMSVLARWVITPRLLGVPGVANVAIWGNRDQQLQVMVDPERLQENDVALSQVVRTAGNALEVSPLSYLEASKPGTGGFIDTPNQRLNIFHEQAISTAAELAQVPIEGADGGQVESASGPLTLGDVTSVVESHQPLIGDTACAGGEACLILVVEKFPNADTAQVSEDVQHALDVLEPGLAGMQLDSSVYEPASYVESSMENLGWSLLAGALLLPVLILAFFWDWRRTAIVAAGVAVSVSTAVLVLNAAGTTVNLMVVTGLMIGLTVLIDDAVTDTDGLDQVIRRHRETGTSGSVWWAVVHGAVSLRSSLLYAALIVAAATVPLLFLWGPGAAFVPPIVLSYLLALAASMAVALSVTPALAMMLLGKAPLGRQQSPVARWLRPRYDAAAPRVTRLGAGLGALGLLAAAGLIAAPFLDISLRPGLDERHVVVGLEAPPDTSLPRMTGIAGQAVEELNGLPGVREANALIGRAVMSDKSVDVEEGEVWVALDSDADYDATVAAIEDTMADNPGVSSELTTYSDQRVRDVLQEENHDVVVRVYGENSDVLEAKVEEVRQGLTGIDGITAVHAESVPKESTIEVEVDLDRAQAVGMKPGDVRRAAAMLLGGITVGHLFQEQKVFDVVVWGAPEIRQDQRDIEQLRIDTPAGASIRLGDVAEVRNVANAAMIRHESVARYIDVTADVAGRDVADVNDEADAMIQDIAFPLDHHAEVLDAFAERQADRSRLIAVAVAAAIAVFLLLQAAFRSWRLALLAFVCLPVAMTGGVLATVALGGDVTLGSIGGLVAVLGIAARGAVLLFRRFLDLQRREGMEFGPAVVARGTGDRLAPTLMSTVAIAAVLAPTAVMGSTITGLEVLQPAVITILGGLLTAAVVNLVILPSLYLRFGAVSDPDRWADELLEPAAELDPIRS